MKKALIFHGGWDGHHPSYLANLFAELLRKEELQVSLSDSLDVLAQSDLGEFDLIVPLWTMGEIQDSQVRPLLSAVENGVGIAGCHGGMCDAFRNSTEYQFMTGGQWVAHPGDDGVEYTVHISQPNNPLVAGIPDFQVKSEQYYMHVDPSNTVLATTRFPLAPGPHTANGQFDMPVVWTRLHGEGRVYYNSLGHHPSVLEDTAALEMMRRGMLWAAKAL